MTNITGMYGIPLQTHCWVSTQMLRIFRLCLDIIKLIEQNGMEQNGVE